MTDFSLQCAASIALLLLPFSWSDTRLGDAVRSGGSRCPFHRLTVWEPRRVLFNRRVPTPQLLDVILVDVEGHARFVQRLYGDPRSPLDLGDFPTDSGERKPTCLPG